MPKNDNQAEIFRKKEWMAISLKTTKTKKRTGEGISNGGNGRHTGQEPKIKSSSLFSIYVKH